MRLCTIVNPGMEDLSKQEIKELLAVSGKTYPHLVEFDTSAEQALTLLYHGQSMRRMMVSLGRCKNPDDLDFNSVAWKDFLSSSTSSSFKVEVENVKGIENRLALAKKIAGKVFAAVDKQKLSLAIELKKPDFLLIVYCNGEEYFIGLDVAGEELHSRAYRVFTHSASCKGDLGYYFVRKTGYKPGDNLLVGFAKDGVTAVEAALFASRYPIHSNHKSFSYNHFPLFKSVKYVPLAKNDAFSVVAFDEGSQNVTAEKASFF